jgi:hypothetical protein
VKIALESAAADKGRLTDNIIKKIINAAKHNLILLSIACFMEISPYQLKFWSAKQQIRQDFLDDRR